MTKLLPCVLSLLLVGHAVAGFAQSEQDLTDQALQAYKVHDYARAQELLGALVKRAPSARNFNLLAMSESGDGKFDQAVTHFRQSIKLGNHSATVHYNLGLSYLQQHNAALGAREIQMALSIDPKLESARYTLAVVLLDQGRSQEALPYLLELRQESPCDAAMWANLIRAQFDTGDTQAALNSIELATRGMIRNVPLLVTVSALCVRYHQPQKARNLLESASELKPDDPDIKLLLAKASLEANAAVEAFAVLQNVPASSGAPGVVSYTRGLALELTGQEEAAQKELTAAVEADPQSAHYLVALAWVEQLQDHQDEALSVLEKAQERDPKAAIVPYRMALSSFLLRRYEQTVQYCNQALLLSPNYHSAYLLLGVVHLEQGDPDGAQAAIQKAINLAPATALYHRELGVVLFKGGHLSQSKKEMDQAVSLDPKAALAYYWRARSLAGLGDEPSAVQDLETAVALQPDNRDAYSELARLYTKAGQTQKANDAEAKEKESKANSDAEYRREFLNDQAAPPL